MKDNLDFFNIFKNTLFKIIMFNIFKIKRIKINTFKKCNVIKNNK